MKPHKLNTINGLTKKNIEVTIRSFRLVSMPAEYPIRAFPLSVRTQAAKR